MAIIEDVIGAFQSNTVPSLVIMGVGFLICHIVHAIRYGVLGARSIDDKVSGFFKTFLFIKR